MAGLTEDQLEVISVVWALRETEEDHERWGCLGDHLLEAAHQLVERGYLIRQENDDDELFRMTDVAWVSLRLYTEVIVPGIAANN